MVILKPRCSLERPRSLVKKRNANNSHTMKSAFIVGLDISLPRWWEGKQSKEKLYNWENIWEEVKKETLNWPRKLAGPLSVHRVPSRVSRITVPSRDAKVLTWRRLVTWGVWALYFSVYDNNFTSYTGKLVLLKEAR